MKVRGARRFREQKWLLDSVISTIGLDWDLLRMSTVTAPIGFEGMGDWAVVASKAKRFDDISPSFEDVAAGREARAREAEQDGNEVTARESYLVASIYYGVAQWPIDEINERNLALNAKKLDCYARYASRAHHKIERIEIPMGKHIVPAWLHFPVHGKPPYPLVIMLPGMDTFKEKLVWGYGDKMLERGFAALAIDGPGQSEALMHGLKVTADNFADAGRACLAWIDTRKDIDPDRVGVFGRSFGSYAATVFSNAVADRLRGVVVGLPCFEPGFNRIFEEASPTYKNRFMFMAGYERRRRVRQVHSRIRFAHPRGKPSLSVHGSRRRVGRIGADQARLRGLQEGARPLPDRRLSKRAARPRPAAVVAIRSALVRDDGGLADGARARPPSVREVALSLCYCFGCGRAAVNSLSR